MKFLKIIILFSLFVAGAFAQSSKLFLGTKLKPEVRTIVSEIEKKIGKRISALPDHSLRLAEIFIYFHINARQKRQNITPNDYQYDVKGFQINELAARKFLIISIQISKK